MYVSFLVLAAGQTKAIARTVSKTHVTEQEKLLKLKSLTDKLWIWLSQEHLSFAGKHQTDELKFGKRELQTLLA